MKRILAALFSAALLTTLFTALSPSQAATPKVGASCPKAGAIQTLERRSYLCVKSGKKLIWRKTTLASPTVTPHATPTQEPISVAPTTESTSYVAKDKKSVVRVEAPDGCADPDKSTFVLQVQSGDHWIPAKLLDFGWEISSMCNNLALGAKRSMAWAQLNIDPGTVFRFIITGDVNIYQRDAQGNGITTSGITPIPKTILIHQPVDGGYGITWENALDRFKDIPAAAWSEAQLKIKKNQNLPSALNVYQSYISPGALAIDPQVGEAETFLKRIFALYARIPAAKNVFFIATTQNELKETEAKMDAFYSKPFDMKYSLESIYGINTNVPAGSVFTHATCQGNDGARNISTYPDATLAAAVILNVCPANSQRNPHEDGVHGMAHEYVHTVQAAILSNVLHRELYEPCWMREGIPEWSQAVVSDSFAQYLAEKHLHPYYLSAGGLDYQQPGARIWSTEEVLAYFNRANDAATCQSTSEFALAYSLGAAASELFISIGGAESLFEVVARLANGESANQAYLSVYGKSWDEIVPIVASIVSKEITLSWQPDALTYQSLPKS